MSIKTNIYKLEAFSYGDIYSASADRRRFTTIDNQLAFIADMIGDGRINGWDVSVHDLANLQISVSAGMGVADRFLTRTFGEHITTLNDNTTAYFYLRRKQNTLGGYSNYSNIANVETNDITDPATPTGLATTSVVYSQVALGWDANAEVDFGYYIVYRSTNNIDFEEIAQSSTTLYNDNIVDENTTYFYRISASDLSDNESGLTNTIVVTTPKDLRQPLPPSSFIPFAGDEMVQLFWRASSFGNLIRYETVVQRLDTNYNPSGSSFIIMSQPEEGLAIIRNLENGIAYSFTIYAVSNNGVYSEGVTAYSIPAYSIGPEEVDDIQARYIPGDNDDINVVMILSWTVNIDPYVDPYIDPYVDISNKYKITLIENGSRVSEPFIVYNETEKEIRIVPFKVNGQIVYESLREAIPYLVIIQTIDDNDNASNGVIIETEPPSFRVPPPISNLQIVSLDSREISATWTNPEFEFFDHNFITVTIRNTVTGLITQITEQEDTGTAETYILPASLYAENNEYIFIVLPVSKYGVNGDEVSSTFNVYEVTGLIDIPKNQSIASDYGTIVIYWNPMPVLSFISFYRIWRSNFTFNPSSGDFINIETVPSDILSYIDHNVIDGQSYMYFVTSVDVYGRESLNPIDDEFISHPFLSGTPLINPLFVAPDDLSVTQSVNDALLTWIFTGGSDPDVLTPSFDGYEIYRSKGNTYSFEKVGNLLNTGNWLTGDIVSFTDEGSLLIDNQVVFYLVRKFKDEAEPFLTESAVTPTGGILLAKVVTSDGEISIDQSVTRELLNLEDPIIEATQAQLVAHKHILKLDGLDKRIDLLSNVEINDWTTDNYQIYSTEDVIEDRPIYSLSITGEIDEFYFTSYDIIRFFFTSAENLPVYVHFNVSFYTDEAKTKLFQTFSTGDFVADVWQVAPTNDFPERGVLMYTNDTKSISFNPPGRVFTVDKTYYIDVNAIDADGNEVKGDFIMASKEVFEIVLDKSAIEQVNRGVSPFLFTVDYSNKTLTVSDHLYADDKEEDDGLYPFNAPPDISLSMLGVSEVSGILPLSRLGDLSATQATSGRLSDSQIVNINHEGRMNEYLIPVQHSMISDNKFNYLFDPAQSFENAVTFYDILHVSANKILAATNRGVEVSEDFGSSWSIIFSPPTAPYKLFYSSTLNKYFALTNQSVYIASGLLESWAEAEWFGSVSATRDITEDDSGNVYVSTDLGVYVLVIDTTTELLTWSQTSIFGPRSTESYALTYDVSGGRLLVSNEFGILESTNEGTTWSFSSEFSESEKIFSFAQGTDVIFGLTNGSVLRRTTGNFVKVTDLDSSVARLIVIYEDRLYITTDEGIMASSVSENIYEDSALTFSFILPEININGNIVPVTSLNVIDNNLFIGTDQRLFIRKTDDDIWLQYENREGNPPSVYVDNELQMIGFVYSNQNNAVSFDEKQNVDAVVLTAVNYSVYNATYGGWADTNYASDIVVRVNNSIFTSIDGDNITFDTDIFDNFVFPEFTERNSYYVGAAERKIIAEQNIARLVGLADGDEYFSLSENETFSDVVGIAFDDIEKFLSQLYESARVVTVNGSSVSVTLPKITANSSIVTVDITEGIFNFSTAINKYATVAVDIIGATVKNKGELTHDNVEDSFEFISSGLPASLSEVQQSNIVKLGIFNETYWISEQNVLSTPWQAFYNTPETPADYDILNSSFAYALEVSVDNINFVLPYAATVLYISETRQVFVGGAGGAYSISVETLEISEIVIDANKVLTIKQFYKVFDIIYALTSYDIYSSSDNGLTWTVILRDGLPNELFSIVYLNNTLVVGGSDGIYFRGPEQDVWTSGVTSFNPVEIMIAPDMVFAVIDNNLYFSTNGSNFILGGEFDSILQINDLTRFNSLVFAATNSGLQFDNGTFYSGMTSLAVINTLGNLGLSGAIKVNNLDSNEDLLVAGVSDASFLITTGSEYIVIEDAPLDSIQNVLIVNENIWVFGYNLVAIYTQDEYGGYGLLFSFPILLSTGVPI